MIRLRGRVRSTITGALSEVWVEPRFPAVSVTSTRTWNLGGRFGGTVQTYLPELATLRRFADRVYWLFDTPKDFHQASCRRSAIVRDPAFRAVPELVKAMEQSRHELRDDVLDARRGLSGATVGGIVLSLGAAVAVALGLWPRLMEYR